jgi:seryl-tRNA synthetase
MQRVQRPILRLFRSYHIDLRRVRDNAQYKIQNVKNRKCAADVGLVIDLYRQHSKCVDTVSRMRAERNALSSSRDLTSVMQQEGKRLKEQISAAEADLARLTQELHAAASLLPCDSHPAAPVGDESNARVVFTHGEKPSFDFKPLSHEELGERLGLFDGAAGRAIAGTGFVVLTDDGVLLEAALVQWALEHARRAGFKIIAPPDVALTELVNGCGFNPRDSGIQGSSQIFSIANSSLSLIGTSEISLAGLHANSIIDPTKLPALYAAVSHCFRREAGGGGARDRGLYRLHQFSKVELFAFVAPEASAADIASDPRADVEDARERAEGPLPPSPFVDRALDALVRLQMLMYAELGLYFRVLDMPTEELGASAYRKFDIEAWMPCRSAPVGVATGAQARHLNKPAQVTGSDEPSPRGAFGEISSASNCADYQSRRLNIRYRHAPKDNRFVHTLNATACAIPRVMLALLETHQQADGTVRIPLCLQRYMGGRTRLEHGSGSGVGKGRRVLLPESELYDLPPGVVLS